MNGGTGLGLPDRSLQTMRSSCMKQGLRVFAAHASNTAKTEDARVRV